MIRFLFGRMFFLGPADHRPDPYLVFAQAFASGVAHCGGDSGLYGGQRGLV